MSRSVLAPLLRVDGLSHHFGGIEVLRAVSFVLGEGSLTGLIGPDGAGKTTLFNVISGLVRPERGSVRLREEELIGRPPHRIAGLGVGRTFEAQRIFPRLSVLENVLAGMYQRLDYGVVDALLGSRRMRSAQQTGLESAGRLIDLLGLQGQTRRLAGELTRGQCRRLEIARALAGEPVLLLLDEPVAGMDGRESADVLAGLRALRRVGQAMLLIEHDMGFVMELCEQVLVLNFGALVARGDPEELRTHPAVIEAYLGRGARRS